MAPKLTSEKACKHAGEGSSSLSSPEFDRDSKAKQLQLPQPPPQHQPAPEAVQPQPHQPSQDSITTYLHRMQSYMHHLAAQQAANHRGQMQLNDSFYHYTQHQYSQDPNPYPWPTPEQFRATVAWPGDRPIFLEEADPIPDAGQAGGDRADE